MFARAVWSLKTCPKSAQQEVHLGTTAQQVKASQLQVLEKGKLKATSMPNFGGNMHAHTQNLGDHTQTRREGLWQEVSTRAVRGVPPPWRRISAGWERCGGLSASHPRVRGQLHSPLLPLPELRLNTFPDKSVSNKPWLASVMSNKTTMSLCYKTKIFHPILSSPLFWKKWGLAGVCKKLVKLKKLRNWLLSKNQTILPLQSHRRLMCLKILNSWFLLDYQGKLFLSFMQQWKKEGLFQVHADHAEMSSCLSEFNRSAAIFIK